MLIFAEVLREVTRKRQGKTIMTEYTMYVYITALLVAAYIVKKVADFAKHQDAYEKFLKFRMEYREKFGIDPDITSPVGTYTKVSTDTDEDTDLDLPEDVVQNELPASKDKENKE